MKNAPEKIYGWINTQLSVARYYGGCSYNGHSYLIDMQDPEKPLVRRDVLTAELKAKKAAEKDKKTTANKVTMLDLFGGVHHDHERI
jgi:hypothetical protein